MTLWFYDNAVCLHPSFTSSLSWQEAVLAIPLPDCFITDALQRFSVDSLTPNTFSPLSVRAMKGRDDVLLMSQLWAEHPVSIMLGYSWNSVFCVVAPSRRDCMEEGNTAFTLSLSPPSNWFNPCSRGWTILPGACPRRNATAKRVWLRDEQELRIAHFLCVNVQLCLVSEAAVLFTQNLTWYVLLCFTTQEKAREGILKWKRGSPVDKQKLVRNFQQ